MPVMDRLRLPLRIATRYFLHMDTPPNTTEWDPAAVRTWAEDQGIEIGRRGRIPAAVVDLYLAQPAIIRRWARRHGLDVGERGRLPADVVHSYLTRPDAVRRWARQQGFDVGERGRIPTEVVDLYLDRFRGLLPSAA